MSKSIKVLALDLPATVRFLRSVALVQAMSETTKLEWKSYDDSTALNVAYTILFWKEKPGWVEISTGRREKVLARANDLTGHYWRSFHAKLVHGPAATVRLLRGYEGARAIWLDTMRQQFANARAINDEVLETTKHAITNLARIKLAADLVVKLTPGPVSLPYRMATTFIKELHEAESANVVVFQVSKEPLKKGTEKLAEKGSHLLEREADGYLTALRNAHLDIARQNDLLRRQSATLKSAARATRRLDEATAGAAAALKSARLAKAGSVGLHTIHWGFVALDVYESWHDYTEAVGM